MATEVGSDIALIQDEDMLRKMWQQTEDFGKKKEIRMRMYKLREQRLKEFYTTGEMIQTETTSKRSSTRTHTESIMDQGFMTMKTKEIRDSESPTEEYQRQSNINKNYYVSSNIDESDRNKRINQTELTSSVKPSEEYTHSSLQTSISSSSSSKWETSQTIISESQEIQKADINLSSKSVLSIEQNDEDRQLNAYNKSFDKQNNEERQLTYDRTFNKQTKEDSQFTYDTSSNKQNIENRQETYDTSLNQQNNEERQLTYDTSSNKQNRSSVDSQVTEIITTTNADNTKQEDNNQYSNVHQKVTETYTKASNNDLYQPVSESVLNKNNTSVDNTFILEVSTNKSDNVEIITGNKIINDLQKLDSYLSTQQPISDTSNLSSSPVSREEKIIKKVEDQNNSSSKKITEGQYTTTYQDSYQQPKISVDLSPSHEAFARSLRSTPERSSPSPGRERASPERRFKSASPEKYRASPEKSGSPPKSLKSLSRRKLSSTQTKDLSKKRANTPTRNEKYDSSDDSDCSAATHGTYDKYKRSDAKKKLFKEETKMTSTTRYSQKSPSTSPVQREKSPGYSSEGSVAKEVRKSSSKLRNSSHESSPERSAFKPVKNYRPSQIQNTSLDNKINYITQEDNTYTNNYMSENNEIEVKNLIKVIKSEVDDNLNKNENTKPVTQNTANSTLDSENKSIHEKFIIEEQVCTSSEQVDDAKITKEPIYNTEINKASREKSPQKGGLRKENRVNQEDFIENEKCNVTNENKKINDVTMVKPREKSPVKEVKPVTKDTTTAKLREKSPVKEVKPVTKDTTTVKAREKSPVKEVKSVTKDTITNITVKSSEKASSNNKYVTPAKKTTSAIPSSIKKAVPPSLEKTPSKKNLVHKDSKDNLPHKTVKKDLSREKVDIKITRNDSKTLIHKNSKENVTPKVVVKKPSQELLIDKKTTISYRNKIYSPEIKTKSQEPIKVIEKKDSKSKIKPTISPQSSQKKLGVVKSNTDTKMTTGSKVYRENTNLKKIPSSSVSKPKTFTPTKSNVNETPSRGTKTYSRTISTSSTTKSQIRKTTIPNSNKTTKDEITKNVVPTSTDLEDELPPDNFESDTDLDDTANRPKYIKNISSNSSSSSDEDEDEKDKQKIKELDDIRNEADEEYGKKMTNKDALLNVVVQLPQSSRESSPEYSARFGQPYCSVSDDASLPRYADVVSEPEDVSDYRLHSDRYDVVTDLDEDTNVTVADRVSKFLNNANKQEELIKTTEIPQSPQAVRKAKQMFESIAKGQIEETADTNDETINESETINVEVRESPKTTNNTKQSTLITRKISGASDYKSRKEFFEKKKPNELAEKTKSNLTAPKIARTSSIKDRRASFEAKADRKIPLKDKTNVTVIGSPSERKNSSPERTTDESPAKVVTTEKFDVKVEEVNKSRRLSGSKTVKDRKATFENNAAAQKSSKENTTAFRRQAPPSSTVGRSKVSETYSKFVSSVADAKTSERDTVERVTSPNRRAKSSEKTTTVSSVGPVSSKSPDGKTTETPQERKNSAKSPERNASKNVRENVSVNSRVHDTDTSTRQRTVTSTSVNTAKTDYGETVKNMSAPKTIPATSKSTLVNNANDEVQIEEIFDLHVLEIMLEKAVGYDRRRRIRAQIRIVKRQPESKTIKETDVTMTRVTKNVRTRSPVKSQKQSNVVVENSEYVKKTEVKKERSVSPQKPYVNPVSYSRSPSPQKTLRSVEETRSPVPQKTVIPTEKARSPSPRKTAASVVNVRSHSPQKSTPAEKSRSPSPKKTSAVQRQSESRSNRSETTSRNSTLTSSTTVTTTKVKSEQVSTSVFQEQNVTDLITSSYGVGPTDDNGRPLFGLRALRKTNTSQSINANDSTTSQVDSYDSVFDQSGKPLFGLKALQNEKKCAVQESKTVYQKVSEQRGGVDQLITDHKGKPLFGLKALQSIGKNEEEPIYEDMPEPPVSPQLKDLVLKHEKHAKESSKLETQPRQKPKAKFRDSFILDTKEEGLYSTFQENGYTDPNSITLRSIIKNPEDDQCNETIIKSKSQSTVFQSKSVMKTDGSGNISVTQDFLKGEVSSVNDQKPSGKLTRGHYSYQSPDDLDSKKGIAKVTTVTTDIGNDNGPEITEITEEINNSDRVDGNKIVKRTRTNEKFESIQKRFSRESFDQDSRRSSKETNGYEKTEDSPQSTPRSSLVRGDSIKALQHKFQQATVSSSLKQNRSVKCDSPVNTRQTEEKTVSTKVNSSKTSGATSFLDSNSRVTGVQDVLTRMRNADLVVEIGDTSEDIEARALLNKFLGASVILHGMEQGGKSPISSPTTTTSASLVNQVEKQRAQKSPVIKNNPNEQDIDNIWDEKQLQILLESCPDYDQRRKIRARLRQIMAEHKACADVVALASNDGTSAGNETNEVIESNSTSVSSKTGSGSYVKTEVHTRTTTSSNRLTKANSVSSSPFAKFQQLERQNSAPNSQTRPCYKFTDPALARSASSIKDRLLNWVKAQTKEYKDLQITNFSTSWSDGLAFCALIHHFYPEAFDYDKLKPENRRENFEIAFKVAEDEAGIAPLLDVEDMVVMRKPDWKCVFTYVQTFYRRFHNTPQAARPSF